MLVEGMLWTDTVTGKGACWGQMGLAWITDEALMKQKSLLCDLCGP